MHTFRKIFFLSVVLFTFGLQAPNPAGAKLVFIDATPSSGVDDGISGFEVELTCTVAASSKTPKTYIADFGDGSPEESIDSDRYSQTFTHFYRAGIYNATFTVEKASGSAETADPVRIVVAKWRFETMGDVESSPAIGPDGTVFVGSDDGNLYALDPETGAEIWRFETGGPIQSAPAVAPDGTIYFGSLDKHIYALKPNGDLKWSFQTGGEIFSSPALWHERGILYIGSNDNCLYAINAGSGTFRWKFTTGDKIISSPSIGHDGIEHVVYFGSLDRNVYALAASGTSPKLKWKFSADAGIYASPAIGGDGRIYIGELMLESVEEYRFKFYCLNVDGTKRWSFTDGTGFYSSSAIGPDGTIFVGSRDGRFFAMNSDGTEKWAVRPGPPYAGIDSSPAVGSNRLVYTGSRKSRLYALETERQKSEDSRDWSFATNDSILYSSPVIDANGTIYFGSQDNYVYAITAGNLGLANSPWPMFRGNTARTGMAQNIRISDIVSTEPGMSSTGADRDISDIRIHFSPDIDPDGINIKSFRLEKETTEGSEVVEIVEGSAVLVSTPYNNIGDRPTAVFTRDEGTPLPFGTTFIASIMYTPPGDGATPVGEVASKLFSFTFTTEKEPVSDPNPDPSADFGCFIGCLNF